MFSLRPRRRRGGAAREPRRRVPESGYTLARAPRREARRSPLRAIRWRRIAVALGAVATAGALVYGGAWLTLGDVVRVQAIEVSGAELASPYAIVAMADLGGASLLTLDTEAAERRIATLPEVRLVSVSRDWPRGVTIEVTEHRAWGYWQLAGSRLPIDADGRVLEHALPPPPDAPTILELGPPSALENGMRPDPDTVRLVARLIADGTLDELRVTPDVWLFRHDRGLTVIIADGPDIVLGDSSNYDFKAAAWGALLDEIERDELQVAEIDLRFGRNVVLR